MFVDTPIEVCRERDTSGLYERADAGEIADFPGVSASYDHAETFDLRLDASVLSIEESVAAIIEMLGDRGHLRG